MSDSSDKPGARQPEPEARPIRDTTRNLIEAIWLDAWPRAGAIVDFGLDSQAHYEAIYYGVREGEITPEALDAALGKGDRLTALARSAPSNPHRDIVFRTSWDAILPRAAHTGPDEGRRPPSEIVDRQKHRSPEQDHDRPHEKSRGRD